jgi:hypothetical protein
VIAIVNLRVELDALIAADALATRQPGGDAWLARNHKPLGSESRIEDAVTRDIALVANVFIERGVHQPLETTIRGQFHKQRRQRERVEIEHGPQFSRLAREATPDKPGG